MSLNTYCHFVHIRVAGRYHHALKLKPSPAESNPEPNLIKKGLNPDLNSSEKGCSWSECHLMGSGFFSLKSPALGNISPFRSHHHSPRGCLCSFKALTETLRPASPQIEADTSRHLSHSAGQKHLGLSKASKSPLNLGSHHFSLVLPSCHHWHR